MRLSVSQPRPPSTRARCKLPPGCFASPRPGRGLGCAPKPWNNRIIKLDLGPALVTHPGEAGQASGIMKSLHVFVLVGPRLRFGDALGAPIWQRICASLACWAGAPAELHHRQTHTHTHTKHMPNINRVSAEHRETPPARTQATTQASGDQHPRLFAKCRAAPRNQIRGPFARPRLAPGSARNAIKHKSLWRACPLNTRPNVANNFGPVLSHLLCAVDCRPCSRPGGL